MARVVRAPRGCSVAVFKYVSRDAHGNSARSPPKSAPVAPAANAVPLMTNRLRFIASSQAVGHIAVLAGISHSDMHPPLHGFRDQTCHRLAFTVVPANTRRPAGVVFQKTL